MAGCSALCVASARPRHCLTQVRTHLLPSCSRALRLLSESVSRQECISGATHAPPAATAPHLTRRHVRSVRDARAARGAGDHVSAQGACQRRLRVWIPPAVGKPGCARVQSGRRAPAHERGGALGTERMKLMGRHWVIRDERQVVLTVPRNSHGVVGMTPTLNPGASRAQLTPLRVATRLLTLRRALR